MAGSALHHSWPALSKLWLKRWAFKRGKRQAVTADTVRPGRDPGRPAHSPLFSAGGQILPGPAPDPVTPDSPQLRGAPLTCGPQLGPEKAAPWAPQGTRSLQDSPLSAPAAGPLRAAGWLAGGPPAVPQLRVAAKRGSVYLCGDQRGPASPPPRLRGIVLAKTFPTLRGVELLRIARWCQDPETWGDIGIGAGCAPAASTFSSSVPPPTGRNLSWSGQLPGSASPNLPPLPA